MVMQRSFKTQPSLFVSAGDLDHPALCDLDSTESVLDWDALSVLMSGIYISGKGRPSYPSLTLFRALLLGIWYGLSDVQLSRSLARDLFFANSVILNLALLLLMIAHLVAFGISFGSMIFGRSFWER